MRNSKKNGIICTFCSLFIVFLVIIILTAPRYRAKQTNQIISSQKNDISQPPFRGMNLNVGLCYSKKDNCSYSMYTDEFLLEEIKYITDLNCNAVRFYGDNPKIITRACKIALQNNLTVFYSPRLINCGEKEMLSFIEACAKEAEILRLEYGNERVCFIAGNELMFDSKFVFNENEYADNVNAFIFKFKIKKIINDYFKREIFTAPGTYGKRVKDAISTITKTAALHFHGKITYASFPDEFEYIDWDAPQFAYRGINLYNGADPITYEDKIITLIEQNRKPLLITEFGTACYNGAHKNEGNFSTIVNWQKGKLKKKYQRNENEQLNLIQSSIKIFNNHALGHFLFELESPYNPYVNDYDSNGYTDKDLSVAASAIIQRSQNGSVRKTISYYKMKELQK